MAVAGGAAAWSIRARAHPITDNDPKDPVGQGIEGETWPYSDMDSGPRADPGGRAGRLGHYSDSDSGPDADPAGHGRRLIDRDMHATSDAPSFRRPVLTDGDAAPFADPPGRGRRPPRE
ncbi:MAG: hypothetical protein QOI38_1763 [Sphingomonadales bacterium]|nr:hypothetical protein [Sphingomonadales bacterium]